ncbi:glycosyltransferase family 4 protein [Leeuwenhoekiella sp. LLG6367-2.1]|uniref:glycosyltransferase family 4 protein n=1 Tax=Leeuwenhoekiella sp. LLG6367-2.1 TaxID=3160833 RepID=UPI00386EA567
MSKKKLAVICNYVLRADRIGGMDRFFVAFDAAAKQINYEVDWFFPDVETFDFYKDLNVFSAEDKFTVETLFLNHLSTSRAKYEGLITHFIALSTPFYKEAKKLGSIKQVIAVDHNPRPLNGFPFKKQLKNRFKSLLYSSAIDRFIGVSSYTAKHIVNDLGKTIALKTGVIYNGIDTAVFKKRSTQIASKTDFKFIVVSHLRESKGIQDLIDAVSYLPETIKARIEISVYGEGPLEEGLKQQAQDLQVSEIIEFKGSSSDIPNILADYDYLIQPTYMECFSLSILESLSANVPVITTTVGGNPEIISDGINGFLFQPKDKMKLSSILKDVVNGELEITKDTSVLIESEYSLSRMVAEHINLLN